MSFAFDAPQPLPVPFPQVLGADRGFPGPIEAGGRRGNRLIGRGGRTRGVESRNDLDPLPRRCLEGSRSQQRSLWGGRDNESFDFPLPTRAEENWRESENLRHQQCPGFTTEQWPAFEVKLS